MSSQNQGLQYYERKLYRLESQNFALKDQLQATKFKLHNMQQIQLKYDLLLGQAQNQNKRLKNNQLTFEHDRKQQIQLIIADQQQKFNLQLKQLQSQHKQQLNKLVQSNKAQQQQLQQKYFTIKNLYQSIQSKLSDFQLFTFKLKKYQSQINELQGQIISQRILMDNQKSNELNQLKINLTKKLKDKYQKEIQTYQQMNKQQNKKIHQLQLQNDIQQQKIKNLTQNQHKSQEGLDKLRNFVSQRKGLQKQQIKNMQQVVQRSNIVLKKSIQQKYQNEAKWIQRQTELKQYIKQIQEQLFQRQKSHTIQLYNQSCRLESLWQQKLHSLQSQLTTLRSQHTTQQSHWSSLSQRHRQQMHTIYSQTNKYKQTVDGQKLQLKKKIRQLKSRLEEFQGKRDGGNTQLMITSLRNIDQVGDQLGKYQNGIIFLERQLKKANIKLQQKNIHIKQLIQQINDNKHQAENQLTQLKQANRKDKTQFLDKNLLLQQQIRDLNNKLRLKQRQNQKLKKQSSFQKIELQKQLQSQKQINEQLRQDFDRINLTSKTLQNQYRSQRDKGLTVKHDITHIKRLKWLQLEKQKNQLQIIFREKQEQLKIMFQLQIDHLRRERDQLKQRLQLAEDQLKQKQKTNTHDKENKPTNRNGDMQKKLATLNLEVALTKNLFQSLKNAKSRLKQRHIDQNIQQPLRRNQQNEELQSEN